ncbi:hypothetical protein CVIRNUC_009990 [Coccomyxa viridis]|uniref:BZIP domain-containing protein n=1 Tax=Coccomyxa viridis TaxID=1274662 RepID=A0AAV1IIY3_9CHLO|nr:hypothetical protein CVIRNUC_009990 [Coccomyxa viridis]
MQPHAQLSMASQLLAQPAAAPSRKRGRPRRYDTTLPLGEMKTHVSAGCATVNGQASGVRKRGAKPKYKFLTAEEAIAHRRERNRSTAMATHERKKARETALKAELELRQSERDALVRLLEYVQQPASDKEMVRRLLLGEEGSQGSVCDAMEFVFAACPV